MKISEVYPDYVFQRLAKFRVVAVDFNTGEFIELATKTVGFVQKLLTKQYVKFYQIEPEEEA